MKKSLAIILCCLFLVSCSKAPEAPDGGTSTTPSNNETENSEEITSEDGDYLRWKETSGQDLNNDGKIDKEDYQIFLEFKEWKKGEDAIDATGDAKITVEDYLVYLEYKEWLKEDSGDYNDDAKITIDDYIIYKDYQKWLDSDDAIDLNGDRKINFDDYLIYIDPNSVNYEKWFNSNDKADYDNNGEIDVNDFYLFSAFGTYEITNYSYVGEANLYYTTSDGMSRFYFRYIDSYFPGTTISLDKNGTSIKLNEDLTFMLGNNDVSSLQEVFRNMVLKFTTATTFNSTVNLMIDNVRGQHTFYFEKNSFNDNFKSSFQYRHVQNGNADINFEIKKIN